MFQIKPLQAKPRIEVTSDGTGSRSSSSKRQHAKTSTASLDSHLQGSDSPNSRRLTPVLTITLPSTEELRHVPATERKPPPSPQSEDRLHKVSTASAPAGCASFKHQVNGNCEQGSADESYKRQVCSHDLSE